MKVGARRLGILFERREYQGRVPKRHRGQRQRHRCTRGVARRNANFDERVDGFRPAADAQGAEPRSRAAQEFLKPDVFIRELQRLD